MVKHDNGRPANTMLAFGRLVAPDDAFEELVTSRGWQANTWTPTFIDPQDRDDLIACPRSSPGSVPASTKQILCPPRLAEPPTGAMEPRLMIAATPDFPTLYFVEWHYIDFVLSCVGNVSEAARVLGIRRSTVQRKRKKAPPAR